MKIKTDMYNPDSDGDGILDGDEVKVRFDAQGKLWHVTLNSHPGMMDSDFDGYDDNIDENPLNWDISDRDLAICSQVAYSYDLTAGLRLDKMSADALNRTDEGFYGTASVSELKGWKVATSYRERKDVAEDSKYGGFSYVVFRKDNKLIITYRGSHGDQNTSISDKKGDWYHNIFSYPFNKDPAPYFAHKTIENIASAFEKSSYKFYITGHSRGGYIAQNALSFASFLNFESQISKTIYFNGLGVAFGIKNETTELIIEELKKCRNKIVAHRIKGDVVSQNILGVHVVDQKTHSPYSYANKDNYGSFHEHSMSHFTAKFNINRYKRGA